MFSRALRMTSMNCLSDKDCLEDFVLLTLRKSRMYTITVENDRFICFLMLQVIDKLRQAAQEDSLALDVLRLLSQSSIRVERWHFDDQPPEHSRTEVIVAG